MLYCVSWLGIGQKRIRELRNLGLSTLPFEKGSRRTFYSVLQPRLTSKIEKISRPQSNDLNRCLRTQAQGGRVTACLRLKRMGFKIRYTCVLSAASASYATA